MGFSDYKEIFKLKEMLEKENIPFEFSRFLGDDNFAGFDELKEKMDGWHLEYPNHEDCDISVIEHGGSYGHDEDLLEIWEIKSEKDVEGWLTAKDVFERIKEHYESIRVN